METPLAPTYLFFNYANDDEEFALRLYNELTHLNLAAWIDHHAPDPNEPWHLAINRALNECTHMLLVWSRHAEQSHEVESEWVRFIALDKPIIIVRRDRYPV